VVTWEKTVNGGRKHSSQAECRLLEDKRQPRGKFLVGMSHFNFLKGPREKKRTLQSGKEHLHLYECRVRQSESSIGGQIKKGAMVP